MPYINNAGVKIFYKTAGDKNNPALVMLHGFGNNAQNWYDLCYVKLLEPHYFLIMIDNRGFGSSDKPTNKHDYALQVIANDILMVIEHEKVGRVHLYGSSYGSIIAFHMAYYHAEYFDSFILQGTSPYQICEIYSEVNSIIKQNKQKGINSYIQSLEKLSCSTFPDFIRRAMQQCHLPALYAASAFHWPDSTHRLVEINRPCLIIIGENEGITQDILQVNTLIPQCQLEIIPLLNHAQAYWAADKVCPIIIKYLSTITP